MVSHRKMTKKASPYKIEYISQPCVYGLDCIQNTVVLSKKEVFKSQVTLVTTFW